MLHPPRVGPVKRRGQCMGAVGRRLTRARADRYRRGRGGGTPALPLSGPRATARGTSEPVPSPWGAPRRDRECMGMSAFHDPVDAVTALPAVRADVGARTDDSRLVQALRAGDEQAFGDLVERYHAAMVRLAILYVSDRAVAEEVAQDAWLGVLRGIDRFEPRATLKTWIFQILVNRAKTSARREGRSVPFSSLNDTAAGDDGPAVEPGRFLEADTAALPAGWWSTGPGGFGVTAEQAALSAEARAIVANALATLVPLGPADVPESRSFRTIGSIASRPFSRYGAVKSVKIAEVHTPHPMAFRQ